MSESDESVVTYEVRDRKAHLTLNRPERLNAITHEQGDGVQPPVWDPIQDVRMMKRNTDDFFTVWRSLKPTIGKVHGYAVAGGSDIALA